MHHHLFQNLLVMESSCYTQLHLEVCLKDRPIRLKMPAFLPFSSFELFLVLAFLLHWQQIWSLSHCCLCYFLHHHYYHYSLFYSWTIPCSVEQLRFHSYETNHLMAHCMNWHTTWRQQTKNRYVLYNRMD